MILVERGISIGVELPYQKLVEFAVEFEQRGLDFIAYTEGRGSAVFPQLAGIAVATQRLKLASWVTSIFTRSPVLIASGIACVDQLSGGRASLGLGASQPHIVRNRYGFPYEKPAARMRDYAQIIRRLLTRPNAAQPGTSAGVTFRGEAISVKQATIDIEPVQEHLPIHIAAGGPHMLRVAGGHADVVLLEFITPGYLEYARALIAEGAEAAGRDPATVRLGSVPWLSIAGTTEEAIQALRPLMANHCSFSNLDQIWQQAGLLDEVLPVREAYLSGHPEEAARRVSDRLVKAVNIAGTLEECHRELEQRVEQWGAMGVGMVAFAVFHPSGREVGYRQAIEIIAGR
jgi:alkanesulfonate monooxygenase SsuD/methylene tetrahydromethanopterin reductase-like flavin-dependent oxidoreductase (luciferase family)